MYLASACRQQVGAAGALYTNMPAPNSRTGAFCRPLTLVHCSMRVAAGTRCVWGSHGKVCASDTCVWAAGGRRRARAAPDGPGPPAALPGGGACVVVGGRRRCAADRRVMQVLRCAQLQSGPGCSHNACAAAPFARDPWDLSRVLCGCAAWIADIFAGPKNIVTGLAA